jgi:RNA polymerase sigma factor (sigma-70 family)
MADDIILTIQRCLAGNDDSWSVFVRDYSKMAISILCRKCSGLTTDDHNDIIQDVFIRLNKSGLKNFAGTSKYEFLAYFNTIVRNEALRYIGARNRRMTISLYADNAEGEDDPPMREIPAPDDSARPDKRAEAQEMSALIATTLSDCTEVDQQVFLLKARGHKDKEVSAILNMPLGTVAVKYSRIKDKLRKKYFGTHES